MSISATSKQPEKARGSPKEPSTSSTESPKTIPKSRTKPDRAPHPDPLAVARICFGRHGCRETQAGSGYEFLFSSVVYIGFEIEGLALANPVFSVNFVVGGFRFCF